MPISTTDKWRELTEPRALYVPFVYMNDASRDQNPLASYGRNNLEKLRRIAKAYDGAEMFQRLQNGGSSAE